VESVSLFSPLNSTSYPFCIPYSTWFLYSKKEGSSTTKVILKRKLFNFLITATFVPSYEEDDSIENIFKKDTNNNK
jgi:hypothetical protein